MGIRDPRVDAYIASRNEFAHPILRRLREWVHATCPDVVETIKWGAPAFEYKGPLCGLAAFKRHAVFGFWKHGLVVGDDARSKQAMGSFGRLETIRDLPPKAAFVRWMKLAMRLNDEGVKVPRRKTRPKRPVALHPEFRAALARNAQARATLEALAPSHRREYVEWIAEAKRDETRARRIAQAVGWLAAGKSRMGKSGRG